MTQQVQDLISNTALNISSEEKVFTAVLNWIKHDLVERKQHIAELISNVRLPLLNREFLMENVETEPLVREDPLCKELLLEAMKYHLLPEQRSSLVSQRTLERKPEGMKPYVFAVGGGSLFAIHNECEVYNPKTNVWASIASMQHKRSRAGVASLRKLLFVCGGYDGENDLASAECYNPLTNEWRQITPMGTKRSWWVFVRLETILKIIKHLLLVSEPVRSTAWFMLAAATTVLVACPRWSVTTLWQESGRVVQLWARDVVIVVLPFMTVASMPWEGSIRALISHRSRNTTRVLAVGCQCLQWRHEELLAESPRSTICIVSEEATDRLTWAPVNDSTWDRTLGKTKTFYGLNIWQFIILWREPINQMCSRRSTHELVEAGGFLYALGGNDGSSSLNSVERYEPATNKWTVVTNMFTRRSSVGASVLECFNLERGLLQTSIWPMMPSPIDKDTTD